MKRYILIGSLCLVAAIGAFEARRIHIFNQGASEYRARAMSNKPVEGKFALTDHNGRAVTQADYRGKHTLVFFGYTYCPDVCPTALQDVGVIMDNLGDRAGKIVPLFISIDPERDTVGVMKDYVSNFHPAIVGLTGSPEAVSAAAKSFRAYHARVVPDENEPEDYHMSHSARLFVMGPDGNPETFFRYGETAENMTKKIGELLARSWTRRSKTPPSVS